MRGGIVAALLTLSSPSAAQTVCAPHATDDEERLAQAANLAGRHEEALAAFQRAHARCGGARALARSALTEATLGRWLDAHEHLRLALDADDPWIQQNRAPLLVEMGRIQQEVGSVLIAGVGPPGRVLLDGREVAAWPMETPVRARAGNAVISVVADGYRTFERTLRVPPGALVREEVTLVPTAAPVLPVTPAPPATQAAPAPQVTVTPPPPRENRAAERPAGRVVAWSAAGLAVAGLTTAIVASVLWKGAYDDTLGPRCNAGSADRAWCDGRADTADGAVPWIYGGFALGGAMAVTAVLSFVLTSPPAPRSAVGWRCGVGPGTIGLACASLF